MTVAARLNSDQRPTVSRPLKATVTLVTGVAGFIGLHVARQLLDRGAAVVGVDALRPGPAAGIAECRLSQLEERDGFTFHRLDLGDPGALTNEVAGHHITRVVHLAARANPRASVADPAPYVRDNLTAFAEVLEFCRHGQIEHLLFASSGSVYGGGDGTPLSSADPAGEPRSFYAATKRANEVMAHSYAACYGLPCTGLRLFNVYGPWARPDSAAMIFARAIRAGRPVPLFGGGAMARSFTYIDDVTAAVTRAVAAGEAAAGGGPAGQVPFRLANVAGQATTVGAFAATLERLLDSRSGRLLLPIPDGDVGYSVGRSDEPCPTPLAEGLRRFVEWFTAHADVTTPRATVGVLSERG